jgi:hypothetical protein
VGEGWAGGERFSVSEVGAATEHPPRATESLGTQGDERIDAAGAPRGNEGGDNGDGQE